MTKKGEKKRREKKKRKKKDNKRKNPTLKRIIFREPNYNKNVM